MDAPNPTDFPSYPTPLPAPQTPFPSARDIDPEMPTPRKVISPDKDQLNPDKFLPQWGPPHKTVTPLSPAVN